MEPGDTNTVLARVWSMRTFHRFAQLILHNRTISFQTGKERCRTQSEINDGLLQGKGLSPLSDFGRQSKWDNKQIFDSVLEGCYNFLVS